MSLERRVWLIAVHDIETGILFQGTVKADSEVEAREKITLTTERMFLGAQRIDFDRVPEGMSNILEAMHAMVSQNDFGTEAGYHIGGPDHESS